MKERKGFPTGKDELGGGSRAGAVGATPLGVILGVKGRRVTWRGLYKFIPVDPTGGAGWPHEWISNLRRSEYNHTIRHLGKYILSA